MRNQVLIFFGMIVVQFVMIGCAQTSVIPTPAMDHTADLDSSLEQSTENLESEVVQGLLDEETPNYCLTCHIDQQQLIDTAKPEEVVESESSGEG